jgi:hypothetical protein
LIIDIPFQSPNACQYTNQTLASRCEICASAGDDERSRKLLPDQEGMSASKMGHAERSGKSTKSRRASENSELSGSGQSLPGRADRWNGHVRIGPMVTDFCDAIKNRDVPITAVFGPDHRRTLA